METLNSIPSQIKDPESTRKSFIEANTIPLTLDEIKLRHIIPVFSNNEPLVSHSDFIEATLEMISNHFPMESVLEPMVRVSHPIQGRIPSARNKPLQYLEEHEKTMYYDRMAFITEINSISETIDGNPLSLCVGGVKAYSMDNLYSRKNPDQLFKIFIGYKNQVCTNLNISTDGAQDSIKVCDIGQLKGCIGSLLERYNASFHLNSLKRLPDYMLSEKQFAQVLGRCRMYQHLPVQAKSEIFPLLINDSQLNTVAKEFYKDPDFSKGEDGSISLWKLYNLFTGAAKSSYIDGFLEKQVNAFQLVQELKLALDGKGSSWFLN